ncbi:hypothetical protein JHK82_048443 [Glycine max]|nr:hypothetical protein JHK82_048443 [Glycine max]
METVVTVRNVLGRWGKKAAEATKKAESLAGNAWQHWELKKMLTEPTGLHVQDRKLIYKKKERDSKSYLDVERVKDGSKLVLLVDIESRERRLLEMLKIAKKEKTLKSLTEIKVEVDKLAKKVAALEAATSTGGVIAELDIETLTENLMRTLIALDEIYGEGELKLQRREQGTTIVGGCRYRRAIPVGLRGLLNIDANYGIRKAFLPQMLRQRLLLEINQQLIKQLARTA